MARFSAKCWQNCATCKFWAGPRDVSELMAAAEVDVGAEGACGVKVKKAKSYATTSCIQWQRWGMLDPDSLGAALSS
ncbi:hypothetical protein LCGC14_1973500 [marine sediment metagenome]|uniref:Uncharacterized protein n=1 Tax=marine sediment metagenome TaxID=412755 RepID=A0A0F9HPE1_9ZZZZ